LWVVQLSVQSLTFTFTNGDPIAVAPAFIMAYVSVPLVQAMLMVKKAQKKK
jgi:hypothetical protein